MARGVGEDGPHPVDRFVGRRVAERRISLGFNQSDLGRALGLTFQQIQKYEKGTNRISSSKLWDMAKFLGVDIGYFFDGLADAQSIASNGGAAFEDFPATRHSVEIARIAPRLSGHQQKLTLDLMKELEGGGAALR